MTRQTFKMSLGALSVVALAFIGGMKFTLISSAAQAQDVAQSDSAAMTCPKCKGQMESGYVRDYWGETGNSMSPANWSPAGSKPHFLSYGKQTKITADRCTNCGYLELYAK
jgi:predicted nucleic-acid-binding Zn-ribbon protein